MSSIVKQDGCTSGSPGLLRLLLEYTLEQKDGLAMEEAAAIQTLIEQVREYVAQSIDGPYAKSDAPQRQLRNTLIC